MINYYNAFISYKHAELDNRIAASIVRGLERYHIPKKIQKATGVKKINRIFRDKDELPITNDLNDTISDALANSDYLIVICSTNTCKSTWVEKEIETFLKNHTMNQVLTVLADGEPYDVIPKVLLTDKKNVQDEHGVYHTVEVPLEPLSCDYRLSARKAAAEELPRLAAALIGCSYDELMNRQRQYKMRRTSAIFAGAMAIVLGFAGYMLYSNTLIHKNYLESLKSQSRYLANESGKQLDSENRIEAMQLALAALPADENDERPITPEAVKAITDASLAYVSLEGSNVSAVWNYRMPNHVLEFKLSDDGSMLAARDMGQIVKVWDTLSHQEVLSVTNKNLNSFSFFDPDTLIIESNGTISAYDLKSGESLWSNSSEAGYNDSILNYSADSILVCNSQGQIYELSIKDGSLINTITVHETEQTYSSDSVSKFTLSPDKKRLAFCLATDNDKEQEDAGNSIFGNKLYYLCEYDLESKERNSKLIGQKRIDSIVYMGDNIYAACPTDGIDGSSRMYSYTYVTDDHTEILCISSGELNDKWSYNFVCNDVSINKGFLPLKDDKIAYYAGNICCIWDCDSGELITSDNACDSIIDISDRDGDGSPMYITQGGSTATPASMGDSSSGLAIIDRFTDDLTDAAVSNGFYTHQYLSSEIIYYGIKVSDDAWTRVKDCPKFVNSYNYYKLDGDVLAVLVENGDGTDLLLFDAYDKAFRKQLPLSSTSPVYRYKLLGLYDNKLYICSREYEDTSTMLKLITCDITTGQTDTEILNDNYSSSDIICTMSGDKLYYFSNDGYTSAYLAVRDLSAGGEKKIAIDGLEIFNAYYIKYFPEINAAFLVCDSDKKNILISIDDGTSVSMSMPKEWGTTVEAAVDSYGNVIAVTNNEAILIRSIEGELLGEISCGNISPTGLTFIDDKASQNMLVVAYSNGTLCRYAANDGSFIGTSDLSAYSTGTHTSEFELDESNRLLYIHTENLLDIVELDSWIETTCIESCYGHHAATDTFFTFATQTTSKETEIGYFEHYSTEALINKTLDILQGMEMSEDQKSMYGIN